MAEPEYLYCNCSDTRLAQTVGAMQEEFIAGVVGSKPNQELVTWISYWQALVFLSFLIGVGKGGTPGASTSAVAINSLVAPHGCIDLAVAMFVPICFFADFSVSISYFHDADWVVIKRLTVPTLIGVAFGSQLVGVLSSNQARLLVGSVLLSILLLNVVFTIRNLLKERHYRESKRDGNPPPSALPDKFKDDKPNYADSIWFATIIGLIGGFATILTNSMGPMLNIYLLTLKLDPKSFVGTRGCFFTLINTAKIAHRLFSQTLSMEMLYLGAQLGVVAVLGVLLAKHLVKRISKSLFTKLEYGLMTYASFKLIYEGL